MEALCAVVSTYFDKTKKCVIAPLPTVAEPGWTLNSWYGYMILTNALLGVLLLEYSWSKTKHFRAPIPELDALMPAWRRNDAKYW